MTSDANAIANSRLLANWLLVGGKQGARLVLPDYNPPLVAAIDKLGMDCSHTVLPARDDAPVICNACRQQIGTVNGLACAVDTVHNGCKSFVAEPPWFKTAGLWQIASAAFAKHHRGNVAIALLLHYIITEYIAGDHRSKQLRQREKQLNDLSRYGTNKSSVAGFECVTTLSTS